MQAISFQCPNCGRQIRVASKYAGRKARCQGCKSVVVIPALERPEQTASQNHSQAGPADIALGDKPPAASAAGEPVGEPYQQQMQYLRAGAGSNRADEAPLRRLPAFIDVFLFPVSTSGLMVGAIFVILPFVFQMILLALVLVGMGF